MDAPILVFLGRPLLRHVRQNTQLVSHLIPPASALSLEEQRAIGARPQAARHSPSYLGHAPGPQTHYSFLL